MNLFKVLYTAKISIHLYCNVLSDSVPPINIYVMYLIINITSSIEAMVSAYTVCSMAKNCTAFFIELNNNLHTSDMYDKVDFS